MATREAIIQSEDVGEAAEGAEALIKKHEDFTKTLAVQDVKINALKDNADRLIDNNHYDSPAIAERISAVLARWPESYLQTRIIISIFLFECRAWRVTTTLRGNTLFKDFFLASFRVISD